MEVELRWCPRPSSRGDSAFSARIPEGSPGSGICEVLSSPVLPWPGGEARGGGHACLLGFYFWRTYCAPSSAQATWIRQLIPLLKQPSAVGVGKSPTSQMGTLRLSGMK